MMARITLRQLRPTLAVLGAVAAFTGCSADEQAPLISNPGSNLTVGLDLSSTNAKAGEQIAVAVRTGGVSDVEFGSVQGTLRFDSNRLSYVGQAVEGSTVTIVNSSKAPQGQMRLISYNVAGIGSRSGALVFAVKTPDYTRGLSFDLELATDRKGILELRRAAPGALAEAADLTVPAGAKPMTMADWNEVMYPGLAASEKSRARVNQPTIANEVYGNANLSAETGFCGASGGPIPSSVNGLDVSYIANLSVGNFDITGSDFPTRDPIIVANVAPATTPVVGLNSNGSRTVDGLDLLAVANEAVGSPRAVVCDLVALPVAPVGSTTITGNITTNTTWTNAQVITIDGIVRVTSGATLTIQPGTRIEGKKVSTSGSPSAIYIERDGFIIAIGEPQRPIVFTCDAALKTKGCWGGLVIAGSGGINGGQGTVANTSATSPIIAGRAATGGCLEQDYEGSGPNVATLLRFGGCNNADSSGVVKFARFEYGGFIFASNKELNNFTLGGVGSKTVVDFIQVHAGNDDGLEIFGGGVNIRHLLSTGNSDDGFDYSQGWTGNAQFVIVQQDSLDADKGLEIDNAEPPVALTVTPLTTGPLYNSTLVGTLYPNSTSGNPANNVNDAINLRRGAHTPFFNMVMMGFPTLMDLDDDATCGAGVTTETPWQSVVAADFTRIDNTDIETNCPPFAAGISIEGLYYNTAVFGNQTAASGLAILRDPYNVISPDFRPVSAAAVFNGGSTAPPAGQGLDVSANYRGAVAPGANTIPWYLPWSRGFASATAP